MSNFYSKFSCATKDYIEAYSVNSTYGNVQSTDIGKLVFGHDGKFGLLPGSTGDLLVGSTAMLIAGIVADVPTTTVSAASTDPFYFAPIERCALYNAKISSTLSTNIPKSTDVGKFIGTANTTTIAGGTYLNTGVMGTAAGTTDGLFFQIARKPSTDDRQIVGTFNSSHLYY